MENEMICQNTPEETSPGNKWKRPSKVFGRLGTGLFVSMVTMNGIAIIGAVIIGVILALLSKDVTPILESSWFLPIMNSVAVYAIGIPVGFLIVRKVPRDRRAPSKLGFGNFIAFLVMCFPLMYGGDLLGTFLSFVLTDGTATNALNMLSMDNPLTIVMTVILAPIMEEFLFRKLLIDRCMKYGEKTAILFSAIAFGLFHTNLFQFFYAFAIGLVFGYVYVRTRRLRYTVLMHMFVNFFGGFLSYTLTSGVSEETLEQITSGAMTEEEILAALPSLAGIVVYGLLLGGLCLAGLVILIVKARKLTFSPAEEELPKKGRFKTVYLNAGTILFVLFCLGMSIANLFFL